MCDERTEQQAAPPGVVKDQETPGVQNEKVRNVFLYFFKIVY